MPAEPTPLVVFLRSHGLDKPHLGCGVVPEQSISDRFAGGIDNQKVKVRSVEGRLRQAFLHLGPVAFHHMVGSAGHIGATSQRVPG